MRERVTEKPQKGSDHNEVLFHGTASKTLSPSRVIPQTTPSQQKLQQSRPGPTQRQPISPFNPARTLQRSAFASTWRRSTVATHLGQVAAVVVLLGDVGDGLVDGAGTLLHVNLLKGVLGAGRCCSVGKTKETSAAQLVKRREAFSRATVVQRVTHPWSDG